MKSEHPESKVTEITSIIAEMWNNVDADTKKRIEEEYAEDKVKVDKARQEYEKAYGKIERKKKVKKNKKKKAQEEDEDDDNDDWFARIIHRQKLI